MRATSHMCFPCPDTGVDKWLFWGMVGSRVYFTFSFCEHVCPFLSLKQMERICVTEHDSINGKRRRLTPSDRFWYREAYF